MTKVTAAQLGKSRLPTATVDIPGIGTVTVRGLSRAEVVDDLNQVDQSVPGAFETRLLALSMVEPALTDEQAAAWRTASDPSEIRAVVDKLNELSGLTKAAAKATWEEFESNPDSEFRDDAGGEAVDDGGAAEG